MFEVEKGVEEPPKVREYRRYPFSSMSIGDSFYIETRDNSLRVRSASRDYMRTHPEKAFLVRRVKDGPGWRCWRVRS